MISLTIPTLQIEGKKITNYFGIVAGEVILGTDIFSDFGAGLSDFFGGRSESYEQTLLEARRMAIKEMEMEAQKLGANIVLGVDIDYETIGRMMLVSATGTAATYE